MERYEELLKVNFHVKTEIMCINVNTIKSVALKQRWLSDDMSGYNFNPGHIVI